MSTTDVWYVLFRGDDAVNRRPHYVEVKGDDSVAHLCEAIHSKWSNRLQLELLAPELIVYKSNGDATIKERLDPTKDLKDILDSGCGSKDNPLNVVIPSVWYTLVQGDNRDTENFQDLAETARVKAFKSAVFSTWSRTLSGGNIQAEDLQVYASEKAQRDGDAELASSVEVFHLTTGKTQNNPLIVVVPLVQRQNRSAPLGSSMEPSNFPDVGSEEVPPKPLDEVCLLTSSFQNIVVSTTPTTEIQQQRAVALAPYHGHQFITTRPSRVTPKTITTGSIVVVERFESGREWDAFLYLRKHMVDRLEIVHNFLDNKSDMHKWTEKWKLYVTGAPGCGKTCFFWMLATNLMQHDNHRVLFVQYRPAKASQLWILEDNMVKYLLSPALNEVNLCQTIMDVLDKRTDKNHFHLCICDGVKRNDPCCNRLLSVLDSQTEPREGMISKISKLVLVTSNQFRVSEGAEPTGSIGISARLSFDSWQLEDFEDAVKYGMADVNKVVGENLKLDWQAMLETRGEGSQENKDLNQTDLLEVVRYKHFFAGGSARFMFDMTLDSLKSKLDICFSEVSNWSVFARTSISYATNDVVNSLMQGFTSQDDIYICAPVSKYVLLHAYGQIRSKVTDAVKFAGDATNNGALKGWAFELQQRDVIHSALELNQRETRASVTNSAITFFPTKQANFDGSSIVGDVVNGTVIWCSKTNQALFDAVFYFDETLVSFQFTVAKTHSVKLEYYWALYCALQNKGVSAQFFLHLGIVRNEMENIFSFDRPTGKARNTRSSTIARKTVMVSVIVSNELTKKDYIYGESDKPENKTTLENKKEQVFVVKVT